uniref:Uncharacterized protein n=1 Tax=Ascaris lumbricoides TaxID=6252 RepID=A0A0M3IBY5_ASCLU
MVRSIHGFALPDLDYATDLRLFAISPSSPMRRIFDRLHYLLRKSTCTHVCRGPLWDDYEEIRVGERNYDE